jgi:hypothetical protein
LDGMWGCVSGIFTAQAHQTKMPTKPIIDYAGKVIGSIIDFPKNGRSAEQKTLVSEKINCPIHLVGRIN